MRALSITLVAMYHINVAYMPTGKVGVDVFFVISGYLITSILLKEHTQGTYSLTNFYVRRVRRILPVLFISLAVFLS
jgi:peptidoglycan/LPS O-acetylase OafA/YrhL